MPKHQTIEQLRRAVADAAADWIESELARSAELAVELGYTWGSPIEERLFLGLAIAAQEQQINVEFFQSRDTPGYEIFWRVDAADRSPVWNLQGRPMPGYVGYARPNPADYGYASSTTVVRVYTQVQLDKYRADLFVEWTTTGFQGAIRRAVVECDGHEFHERTKEQARHDRRRDRDVQGFGLPVLRFTGSEIYANAVGCGKQVLRFFQAAEEREDEARWARFAQRASDPPEDDDV